MSGSQGYGPQIFTPDWSNPNQSAGSGWGAGISALGQALFPNPATMAEARLRQAQTQQAQQSIGIGQTQIAARSKIASVLSNPGAMADPGVRGSVLAAQTALPADEQNSNRAILSTAIQNVPNMSQQDKDSFIVSLGTQTYGGTQTGGVRLANIAAGPGYAQAGATVKAAQIGANERRYEHDNTQIPVLDANAVSGTGFASRKDVLAGHYSPILPTDEQRSASSVQASTPPASHGQPPPPTVTGTTSNAASATGDGSPAPTPTPTPTPQQTAGTVLKTLAGQPPGSNEQSTLMDATLRALTKQDFGTSHLTGTSKEGTDVYELEPQLKAVVGARANELMRMRLGPGGTALDPGAAVTQAYTEFMQANRGQLTTQSNMFSGQGPQVVLKSGAKLQPFGAETPLVPSGKQAIPSPAPAPAPTPSPAPAPAPGGGGTPTAVAGRTVSTRGGKPLLYTGGDPKSPASWRAASPAEISAAQQSGNLYQ